MYILVNTKCNPQAGEWLSNLENSINFADTVNRLGFDYVQDKLLHAQIDKSAVLEKKVKGGATC
mgnify:CR=1 FL=1